MPKNKFTKAHKFGHKNLVTLKVIKNVSLPDFVELSWPNQQFLSMLIKNVRTFGILEKGLKN